MADDPDIEIDIVSFEPDRERAREAAHVEKLRKAIEDAREFDEDARAQYAVDRQTIKAHGAFKVDVPIAASYIDVLKSFLYASNPGLNARPAEAVDPPPRADLLEVARDRIKEDPAALAKGQRAGEAVLAQLEQATRTRLAGGQPAPDIDPEELAQQAVRQKLETLAQQQADALARPFHRRHQEARAFAKTLEIVIERIWQRANLKGAAKQCLGSGLSVGIGWLKATWQEQYEEDPTVAHEIGNLKTRLTAIEQRAADLAQGDSEDPEAEAAELKLQIEGLQENLHRLTARGLAIDFIAAEDLQVAPGTDLDRYTDAPWIAHRVFMPRTDAKPAYPDIADELDHAHAYYEKKDGSDWSTRTRAEDAERFTEHQHDKSGPAYVAVWEYWDRLSGQVITFIEGVDQYACAPYDPDESRRFYPFFQFAPVELDGERHPQSLVARSKPLLDEYNRARSEFSTHRARAKPGVAFDETNLSSDSVKKLVQGQTGEWTPVKPAKPGAPINQSFFLKAYPPVDMNLYSTAPIRAELEMIWGIQEALASSIHTAKTATESQIENQGTMSRLDFMRDALDEMLSALACYCAEILLQHLSRDDVAQIAGRFAFWPEAMAADDLDSLVLVDIRAGSSGKPNTLQERKHWMETLPIMQNAIMTVGKLRGSTPDEIADKIENLIAETIDVVGERLDPDRFLPKGPQVAAPQLPEPVPVPGQQPNQRPAANTAPNGGAPDQPPQPQLSEA